MGYRIAELLDTELRAAAVSTDDAIRHEAAILPAEMARDSAVRKEPGIVRQDMRHLESACRMADLSGPVAASAGVTVSASAVPAQMRP